MSFVTALVCSLIVVALFALYLYVVHRRFVKDLQELLARERMYTEYMIAKIKKEIGEE
jgi:predicted PurR-regulated permease PerM